MYKNVMIIKMKAENSGAMEINETHRPETKTQCNRTKQLKLHFENSFDNCVALTFQINCFRAFIQLLLFVADFGYRECFQFEVELCNY